jgi:hypothetical protein
MASAKLSDIKKYLRSKGFLVYRSSEQEVQLAELVRENLIMDASVSVVVEAPLRVRFLTRAQRSDFPWSHESPAALFERARRQGVSAASNGFREVATSVAPQADPMDPGAVLDVWYQVGFEREVPSIEEIDEPLAFALGVEKVAPR